MRVILCAIVLMISVLEAGAIPIISYYSPRNRERPARRRTDYIILHTTEGARDGSLNKVYERGEAHYLVDESGRIYNVINRRKVAYHAGVSMWRGRVDIDNYAIGIEVVGYYNRPITAAQYASLKGLITWLQGVYKVTDDRVLTHSMVAYGEPNRWHKKRHRGRKRCGMQFAQTSVRYKLGLSKKPLYDPDVKAGRLIIADYELARALYGSAREEKPPASVASAGADTRRAPVSKNSPAESAQVSKVIKTIGVDGKTARDIADKDINSKTTIYFLTNGSVKRGDEMEVAALEDLPAGTKMLVDYIYGGRITAKKSAFEICGSEWNQPTTLYRLTDGTIETGDDLDENQIPINSLIFYQK